MDEPSLTIDPAVRERLVEKASNAIACAYAPYSRYRVGAAVLTQQGNLYAGSNVENASYGLTVCAERTAIFNAVSHEGPSCRIVALAVASEKPGAAPCGACRQVAFEFGPAALVLHVSGPDTEVTTTTVEELLPAGFSLPLDEGSIRG